MSRMNRFIELKSRLASSKWVPLFVRSLVVSTVVMAAMTLAFSQLAAYVFSVAYSEPRKLQVLLLDALGDTADVLESNTNDAEALQQTLVRDIERWLGEIDAEGALEAVLGTWSSPGITIQILDSQQSMLAQAELHAARLELAEANVRRIRIPLISRNGEVLGLADARIVADFDLAASLRQSLASSLGITLVLLVPMALLIAMLSAWNSIRFLNRQFDDIAQVARAWSDGDFDARIRLSGKRELTQLAEVLNQMAQSLNDLYLLRSRLAAIEERGRVARELHDTIRQRLFGVSLQLGVAKAKWRDHFADTAVLDQIQRLVKETQSELKCLIDNTNTGASEVGIAEEISGMVRASSLAAGVSPILDIHEPKPLQPQQRHQLSRIVQEALSNIARHASANEVRVELKEHAGEGVLRIRDDGSGFAVSEVAAGFGLNAMRARTKELPGGCFDLESFPGEGTRIEIRWKASS